MKTRITTFCRMMVISLIAALFAIPAKAQISPDTYYNIDWQFNIPLGNNFANKASGWGMNFEGGYYFTDEIALGLFLNYSTNNEYFSRRTITANANTMINTDQQHSLFQMPFGVTGKYRFDYGMIQPYVGLKLGANYAQMVTDFFIYEKTHNTWGFYMSPEIGANIYPWVNGLGFHVAIYYSFATNSGTLWEYDLSSLNNLGFRLGVAF